MAATDDARTALSNALRAYATDGVSSSGVFDPPKADVLDALNMLCDVIDGLQVDPIPTGTIAGFGMTAVPSAWLEGKGQNVSRTTYADLYAVFGTTYGTGDGSTTFTLPDLRGRFLRGWDHSAGVDPGRAIGTTQGFATAVPQATASSRQLGGSTSSTLGGGAASPNKLGFARVSMTGETVTAGTPDTDGAGSRMDIVNVMLGDSETRPVNVSIMFCVKT